MSDSMFRSAFTQTDLIDTATVVCNAGQYNKLGEYKVLAGELVAVGYGNQSGQENAQGRIYADIRDNTANPGAVIPGTVRVSIYSAQDRPLEIIEEFRTETISAGSGDRTKQVPWPLHNAFVPQDKKIVLEFKPDATATVGLANSKIVMDITKAVA